MSKALSKALGGAANNALEADQLAVGGGRSNSQEAAESLIDKPFVCPCCDNSFTNKVVDTSKIRMTGMDSDLRSYYEPVDPVFYDVIICPKCGYAALSKIFDNLSFEKAQTIMNFISPRQKDMTFPQVYSVDIALIRYKAALMCALITGDKSSILAVLYLRMAWLHRMILDEENETRCLVTCLEAFREAVSKEYFPLVDMDEKTTYYIMGSVLAKLRREEEAVEYFNRCSKSSDLSPKLSALIKEQLLKLVN